MFSGSMDILVIESPNGIFKSSSFHVRFGSLKKFIHSLDKFT